jgi:acyl-CoA synthetase (NDP forming)
VWRALAKQTGSLLVDNLTQFIDTLAVFQASTNLSASKSQTERESSITNPPESHTKQVLLFGNGGGASVLAADTLARYGLNVGPLKPATISALKALKVPAGASLDNPIDVPANVLQRENGALALRILQTICSYETPQAIIMHLNLPVILGYRHVNMLDDLVRAAIALRAALPISTPLLLVLRSSGQLIYENARQACTAQAMQAGIPVFTDLPEAAQALHALDDHTAFLRSRVVVT